MPMRSVLLMTVMPIDWKTLGPEGGGGGGEVVAAGTPEQVAAHPTSHTGRFLAPVLRGEKADMPGGAE